MSSIIDDVSDSTFLGEKNPYDIIKDLYTEDNIEFITDLTTQEIHSIAVILFLADYTNMPEFRDLLKYIMKLKVSKNRKGREDFKQMFTGVNENVQRDKDRETKMVKG